MLRAARQKVLIDADGLAAVAEDPHILRRGGADIILTPHTGELSRIIRRPREEIELGRIAVARKTSRHLSATLILKGAPTVTAGPDGAVYVNPTGNPGMATAGSGDVLAGLIAGLWAQGMAAADAAAAGVYVHGLAGDLAQERYGEKSLLALDIQAFLPAALRRIAEALPHAIHS